MWHWSCEPNAVTWGRLQNPTTGWLAVPSASWWLSLFRAIETGWIRTEPLANRRLGFEVVHCKYESGSLKIFLVIVNHNAMDSRQTGQKKTAWTIFLLELNIIYHLHFYLQREEERRQQEIEDWENHRAGKGYKSKLKNKIIEVRWLSTKGLML